MRAEYRAMLYNYLLNKHLSLQTEPAKFQNILENPHELCNAINAERVLKKIPKE